MLMMTCPAQTCPNCGDELSAENSAGGLCGRCLFERGIEFASTACFANGSTPSTVRFDAPDPIEVEADLLSFDVLALIGQGGMGAVYKARQRNLDRTVAIKILPRQAAGGQEFADRFGREARALARLRHEHIVMAYDFGLTDRYSYCVMEYVGGPNLREYLRGEKAAASKLLYPQGRGRTSTSSVEPEWGENEADESVARLSSYPLPGRERGVTQPALSARHALEIARDICTALQYAHENGVVHRDIKPENVLLDEAGRVKIADFGLAKLLQTDPRDLALTQTRHFIGTLHYMAPEQCERPHEIDHRADIYSLGVVLYEMLTGELPLGRFDPPSSRAALDPRVDELVMRALEKDPARRYESAAAFGEAIDEVLVNLDEGTSAPANVNESVAAGSGARRRIPRAAAIIGGLFAFFAAAYFGWQIFLKYERDKDGKSSFTLQASGGDDQASKVAIQSGRRMADVPKDGRDPLARDEADVGPGKRSVPSNKGTAADVPSKAMQVYRLSHTRALDTLNVIETLFRESGARLVADERTNSILAQGDAETLAKIESIIARLDVAGDTKDSSTGRIEDDLLVKIARVKVLGEAATKIQTELEQKKKQLSDLSTKDKLNDEDNRKKQSLKDDVRLLQGKLDQLEMEKSAAERDVQTLMAAKSLRESQRSAPSELSATRLGPGYRLRISVAGTVPFGHAPIDGVYIIDADGYINLGAQYGKVKVSGMIADEAQKAIVAKLRKVLRSPQATVTIETFNRDSVGPDKRNPPDEATRIPDYPSSKERQTSPHRKSDPNDRRTNPRLDTDRAEYPETLLQDDINSNPRMIELLKKIQDVEELYRYQRSVAKDAERDSTVQRSLQRLKQLQEAEQQLRAEIREKVLARLKWERREIELGINDFRSDVQVVIRRMHQAWNPRSFEPKSSEERTATPIVVDAVKVQPELGGMVLEYLIFNELQDVKGRYFLVIAGPHIGRNEFALSDWPQYDNRGIENRTGRMFLPRNFQISNDEPIEISIERETTPESKRVRVSNLRRVTWKQPGAPTEDIRYPKGLMKPFTAIHWEKDRLQVEIEGRWYELVAINDLKYNEQLLKLAKEKYPDDYQKKIEDDLESLLKELGQESLDSFKIILAPRPDGPIQVIEVRRDSDGRMLLQRRNPNEKLPADKESDRTKQ